MRTLGRLEEHCCDIWCHFWQFRVFHSVGPALRSSERPNYYQRTSNRAGRVQQVFLFTRFCKHLSIQSSFHGSNLLRKFLTVRCWNWDVQLAHYFCSVLYFTSWACILHYLYFIFTCIRITRVNVRFWWLEEKFRPELPCW